MPWFVPSGDNSLLESERVASPLPCDNWKDALCRLGAIFSLGCFLREYMKWFF